MIVKECTVVMKSSNADGAKGLNHPTDTRSQLEIGRTNGRSKVGTYQSDDKSRMRRGSEAGQKPLCNKGMYGLTYGSVRGGGGSSACLLDVCREKGM